MTKNLWGHRTISINKNTKNYKSMGKLSMLDKNTESVDSLYCLLLTAPIGNGS